MAARSIGLSALGLFVVGAFLVFVAYPRVEAGFVARSQDESGSTLRLVSDAVDQAIGRHEPVPGLIAGDPKLIDMLTGAKPDGIVPFVNEKLRQIAMSVAASEIYVLDVTGTTLASSNYREPDSFIGKNFAFRPYFQRAVEGQTARFHALGTTSGERGFFFFSANTGRDHGGGGAGGQGDSGYL